MVVPREGSPSTIKNHVYGLSLAFRKYPRACIAKQGQQKIALTTYLPASSQSIQEDQGKKAFHADKPVFTASGARSSHLVVVLGLSLHNTWVKTPNLVPKGEHPTGYMGAL